MNRDPKGTRTAGGGAEVWFARIRSGRERRAAAGDAGEVDPLLAERVRSAAEAATAAAERAARAAKAADRAAGLADLLDSFGRPGGVDREELLAAAGEASQAGTEAQEGGERAANQGRLAQLAAQDEGTAAAPELRRDPRLGELWHR